MRVSPRMLKICLPHSKGCKQASFSLLWLSGWHDLPHSFTSLMHMFANVTQPVTHGVVVTFCRACVCVCASVFLHLHLACKHVPCWDQRADRWLSLHWKRRLLQLQKRARMTPAWPETRNARSQICMQKRRHAMLWASKQINAEIDLNDIVH